jgi:D-glycero-D-manno-heptose 1,7-bisphosphate phosphatase
LPRSIAALNLLRQHSYSVFIITNQSAINRKLASLQTLHRIHAKMKTEVRSGGGLITDIFFCPHKPEDRCSCRKPKPGLILTAQNKYKIDLPSSYMIGDSAKDIECARQAGCGYALLVRSDNYPQAKEELSEKGVIPDHTAVDLFDAVQWILAYEQ